MTATLRVVLDQVVLPTDPDLETASLELARSLVDASPAGTAVAAIAPQSPEGAPELAQRIPDLVDVHRVGLGRAQLTAAWQLGMVGSIGGGMIHSPTLLAPLVKHDRAHDHDQTVVTVWDLEPWRRPDELPRASVAANKALLRRAVKYADAVVVPTHAHATELAEIARLGARIRVVPGAPPTRFVRPTDAEARRRDVGVERPYVLVTGGPEASDRLGDAFHAIAESEHDELAVVVMGRRESDSAAVVDLASAAGLPERRVTALGPLDAGDRAALLDAAHALIAPSVSTRFPWRILEALTIGTPVIAAGTPVHTEVLADAAQLVAAESPEAIAGALGRISGDSALYDRMRVLSADRGRAFSWRDAAERVWQLHAEL